MRRVITAVVMLVLSIVGTALITIILNNRIETTDNQLLYLYENIDMMNDDEIRKHVFSLTENWNKTEKILKFVSVHDKIISITEAFTELDETVNYSDKNELKKLCAMIKIKIETLYVSEKPFAENIF